ncbi:unnamed protein product [Rhizophagus irregularis]|uniref:Zinc finger bed domain-containing protein 1-like n=1 Tax=Rhizophagus irregularis TaxID=588596 RepID=A0A916EES4_9GLOM|nr:unnamed protein product [Rhizophagus irregularis]
MSRQSQITSFLTTSSNPSPSAPSHEDLIQPSKKQKRTRKRTSWIWEHFIKDLNENNEPVIVCQVIKEDGTKCNVQFKHDGSTSNGNSHLWSAHQITKVGLQPEEKQLNVIEKHTEKRQTELQQFLTNWIVDDLLPFSVVNSTSFRIFCNELDPTFLVPEAKTIKAIIHKAYNYIQPKIIEQIIKEATSVSLTTDLWTGRNRKGFIGITCSYLDSDFTLKEIILTVQYVRYPHTAENIAECIENILNQWKIRHLTTTIITNNTSNMKKCVKLLDGISWIGCFSHTLQLVVGKGLFVARNLILRVKRLIDFFMTPKQSERLTVIQKEYPSLANYEDDEEPINSSETAKYLNTIADVSTRWNSSYLAWCRLLKLKGYIKELLNYLELQSDSDSRKDAKRLKNIMITEDEWLLIHDLKEILFYFAEATNYLGGSKYCTYSSINPTIAVIMMNVLPSTSSVINFNLDEAGDAFDEALEIDENQSESQEKININVPVNTYGLFDLIKKNLYIALIHYFNPTSPEALLAALLDPRFKKLKFATQEQKKDAEDELHERYNTIKLVQLNPLPSASPQQRKKRSLFDAFTKQTVAENESIS